MTDVREGSAQYATAVMTALAALGCDASEEALGAYARAHAQSFLGADSLHNLPYRLGFMSGFFLRERGDEDWEAKVMSGTPPADLLLSPVAPVPQEETPALVEAAKREADARNAVAAQEMEPLIDRMDSVGDRSDAHAGRRP